MKILVFNGSPHKKGNTAILLEHFCEVLKTEEIETELLQVGASNIKPCKACDYCRKSGTGRCIIKDDPLNEWFEMIIESAGFIIGSPTYFFGPSAEMKCFIDRIGYLGRIPLTAGETVNPLYRKVGGAIAVDAWAGNVQAAQAMQTLFMVNQMIVPGANYYPVGKGATPGDVNADKRGIGFVEVFAKNVAWLVKKLQ